MANLSFDNDDYSVIDKAAMVLAHNPVGLTLPGIDHVTHREATRLCARDYLENHVFFNEHRFHNHLNHHLLAAFSMGASPARLQRIFDINKPIQRPALVPCNDVTITPDNFTKYLSDESYYPNFVAFYRRELAKSDDNWSAVVAHYAFHPDMFPLFMSGLLHPFIQLGYGLEFKSEAIIATALAQASVHQPQFARIFDRDTFDDICAANQDEDSSSIGLPLLAILDKLRNDPLSKNVSYNDNSYTDDNRAHAEALAIKYAKLWTIALPTDASSIAAKCKEVMTVVALVYGALTRPGYKPALEFAFMHFLTSSYFIPIIFDALPLVKQARLLRAYVASFLALFVMKGCPPLYITPELTSTNTHHHCTSTATTTTESSPDENCNPWMHVFSKAIACDDMHAPKAVRALWRISLLDAFPPVCHEKSVIGYELPPPINCLHLARLTVDTITSEPKNTPTNTQKVGDWVHGMIAFDEFWAHQDKEL